MEVAVLAVPVREVYLARQGREVGMAAVWEAVSLRLQVPMKMREGTCLQHLPLLLFNCGKPKDDEPPVVGGTPPPCDKDSTMPGVQPCDEDDVDGGVITSPPDDDVDGGVITSPPDDDVLGGRIYRPGARPTAPAVAAAAQTRGGALPFTGGGNMVPLALLALGLIAVGALVLRGRRAS